MANEVLKGPVCLIRKDSPDSPCLQGQKALPVGRGPKTWPKYTGVGARECIRETCSRRANKNCLQTLTFNTLQRPTFTACGSASPQLAVTWTSGAVCNFIHQRATSAGRIYLTLFLHVFHCRRVYSSDKGNTWLALWPWCSTILKFVNHHVRDFALSWNVPTNLDD